MSPQRASKDLLADAKRVTDCCGPTLDTTSKMASFFVDRYATLCSFRATGSASREVEAGQAGSEPRARKGRYHFPSPSPSLVSSRLGEPRRGRKSDRKIKRFPFVLSEKKNRTTLSELRLSAESGPEIVPTSHRDSHRRALDGSLPHPSRRFRRRNGPFFGWPRPPVGKKLLFCVFFGGGVGGDSEGHASRDRPSPPGHDVEHPRDPLGDPEAGADPSSFAAGCYDDCPGARCSGP